MGLYLSVIIVGRLAVGVPLAGRCYCRLAHAPSVLGLRNMRDYTYNLAPTAAVPPAMASSDTTCCPLPQGEAWSGTAGAPNSAHHGGLSWGPHWVHPQFPRFQ